jgi:hypothetical protein
MAPTYPKPIKRKLRQLAGLAYERALSDALGRLEREFIRWRKGQCDPFQLEERIHEFHEGIARDLLQKFSPQAGPILDFAVAEAIVTGKITSEEAGPEVLDALRPRLESAQDELTSDLLRRAAERPE